MNLTYYMLLNLKFICLIKEIIKYDIPLNYICFSKYLLISLKFFIKQINFKLNYTWYIKFINFKKIIWNSKTDLIKY